MTRSIVPSVLLVLILTFVLLPRLAEQVVSNEMLVWALKPLSAGYQPATGAEPNLDAVSNLGEMDKSPVVLHARGVRRWLSGDVRNAFADLWDALDADPANDRFFLTLMSFYARTGVGTYVTTRPLVLSGKWNLEVESRAPLVISRFARGPEKGGYLQYHGVAVEQGWSRVRMNIQGQVLGGENAGCDIYPGIVFWKDGLLLSETGMSYPVQGQFVVDYWIKPPAQATHFTPRITPSEPCLGAGQRIRIDSVALYPEH